MKRPPADILSATYGFVLAGTVVWCAAILAAPMLGPDSILYQFFRPICHQIDDRSFHLFGKPLAVCSRCCSVYFTFLLGLVFYPWVRSLRRPALPPRAVLLISLLPMALDVGAGMIGVHEVTNATRALTGAIAGIVLPFFVLPAFQEAMLDLSNSQFLTSLKFKKGDIHA